MTTLALRLPDDLSHFVAQTVKSGEFLSTDDFFVSVLTSLKAQAESVLSPDEEDALSALKTDIALAERQLDAKDVVADPDWNAFLAERHRGFAGRAADER